MEKQTDLRVVKTRLLIKNAFNDLVREHGFEKITVSDIANKAMINRATFYLHYQDKYDLLSSIENEVFAEINEIAAIVTREYLEEYLDNGLPFPHIVNILSYIQENIVFFNLIIRDNVDPSFFYKLSNLLSAKIVNDIFPELEADARIVKYYIPAALAVFTTITNQWLKDGMKESKNEIAALMTKIPSAILKTR